MDLYFCKQCRLVLAEEQTEAQNLIVRHHRLIREDAPDVLHVVMRVTITEVVITNLRKVEE
jgi:hypothetical protein